MGKPTNYLLTISAPNILNLYYEETRNIIEDIS